MLDLDWEYDGEGSWISESAQNDDGCHFEWIIEINERGYFDVSESDTELTDRKEPFDTLKAAKEFCQVSENRAIGVTE